MNKLFNTFSIAGIVAIASITGCGSENESAPTKTAAQHADDDGHDHGDHDEPKKSTAGHGGAVIRLGSSTFGSFDVMATRDEGLIVAGKDAPIDVTVMPGAGSTAKAVAVRFWIGTEDAMGSMKAKSEIENSAEPNRWHTHAEIPNPIPAGSKLWVEIETDKGEKFTGSFELKS